ncbi:glycerophosphodiester phosphodiesterase [Pikeienuella piscinae]|uniref:glycerophosphodiester phosphodiesterase n=1 Tax=Pikeienuella piscinae TaxID=2748098 RepID=A0A7L5BZ24_9RHOB|nr:glycerophosphodiester phosphodiesterase family protein [Pikeienuella piscinae]QIE55767.1 glycerophosphodiester phosphodiesterase [Pikeienuella piscinae]
MRVALLVLLLASTPAAAAPLDFGDRPARLVAAMAEGRLKARLEACAAKPPRRTLFSIGHRGAPRSFPEHSAEGYRAAARMGAGIVECDVNVTRDGALVCRHADDDLPATTDILLTDLAAKCRRPFAPGRGAECRTSDLTLAEFRSLKGRMTHVVKGAATVEGYMADDGARGALMTHADSIALLAPLGVKFTPELKAERVVGAARQALAGALIDEYRAAGVPPGDVWPQSFQLDDIRYWIAAAPEFARQAVYLDGRYRDGLDPLRPETFHPSMAALKSMGVNIVAPPIWMLLTERDGRIVAAPYAEAAKAAGLKIIAWTLERGGPPGADNWYYRSIPGAAKRPGALYKTLDALAREVGVIGVFSDWAATVSAYANCMELD